MLGLEEGTGGSREVKGLESEKRVGFDEICKCNATPLPTSRPTVKQRARQECRSAKRGKAPISKTRSRSELASGIITKLKIDSNPFAKGFRDSSRLTDFER
ncbi:hypothetical protein DBV15_00887 [Temnothorax longispinosus]|uniref:T-box domain-containing protein n=1 Tax=Temnothorax longispinosus TaxID=300112 RepID=A0A4V3S6B0_9HYME|nr:hypothetical protein DBV15_00887 [Temnothorax longispinosus]